MSDISINHKNVIDIDITPSEASPTWALLGEGFTNIAESLNEVLSQMSCLNDAGWGRTEVTGGQITLTLTGMRHFGDAAQDYIFSDAVKYNFGNARKTRLRIRRGNQAILQWGITLANVTDAGGDANQPSAITVAMHGNGAPELLTDIYLEPLTVVSVAGTGAGNTAIYVNPVIEGGHSYKYKAGASVDLPQFDAVLTTGWASWNGTANIAAASGSQIVIAEVNTADNKAKKAGKAIVTAAS